MKQNKIFNFLWWFSTPFFTVFFFILLLLYIEGRQFAVYAANMLIYLLFVPIFFEWLSAVILKWKLKSRSALMLIIYIMSFYFAYIHSIKMYLPDIKYFYSVFALAFLASYALILFDCNQYAFLIAMFTTLTYWISAFTLFDMYLLIIAELVLSAFLFKYFIKYEIDNLKGISLSYFSGIITTILFIFAMSFIF